MIGIWIAFILFVLVLLALDLGVFNRHAHVITVGEALAWTGLWITLALAFNVAVYFMFDAHWQGIGGQIGRELTGSQAALQFLTGYVVEKSLSLDNIFVIALIFSYFRVPAEYQHRVLFWGILGALALRGAMIAGGTLLIQRFEWITYVFGAFLIATAVKMLIARHDNLAPDKNPLIKLARRWFSVSPDFQGQKFFTNIDGRRAITPLMLVLLLVESTDVLFAVDSIPAIFAVTRDPFLVFTSNVFAILGLRSLYFALAGVMSRFRYLKMSLVFLLAFIGVKMLLTHHHPIPTPVSLAVIGGILSVGVLASIFGAKRDTAALASPLADEIEDLVELTYKQAKRIAAIVIGSTLLLVGIAMLALPGPGLLVIVAALAILGTEFLWARRLLKKVKTKAGQLTQSFTGKT
jgi:tellurite resistance protein TerC